MPFKFSILYRPTTSVCQQDDPVAAGSCSLCLGVGQCHGTSCTISGYRSSLARPVLVLPIDIVGRRRHGLPWCLYFMVVNQGARQFWAVPQRLRYVWRPNLRARSRRRPYPRHLVRALFHILRPYCCSRCISTYHRPLFAVQHAHICRRRTLFGFGTWAPNTVAGYWR